MKSIYACQDCGAQFPGDQAGLLALWHPDRRHHPRDLQGLWLHPDRVGGPALSRLRVDGRRARLRRRGLIGLGAPREGRRCARGSGGGLESRP